MTVEPPLVRIAADYDCPQIMAQTPGKIGLWDGIRFTLDDAVECDYFVMLNNRRSPSVRVSRPR
jgi:hypothetical protein